MSVRPAAVVTRPPHRPDLTEEPPRSHTARVVRDLGLGIVSGRHAEGSILPGDAELMERFAVSRTVLREALKMLAAKGLIQAKARIGTRVLPRTEWNLFDPDVLIWHARNGFDDEFLTYLGEMRMALEPEAAALAAARRTPEQLATLYAWVDKMGAARNSAPEFVKADLNFHLAVAATAANPFLTAISTLIEVALVAMLTISSPVEEPAQHTVSVNAHRDIADAIAAGDAEKARAAMRLVITQGLERRDRRRG